MITTATGAKKLESSDNWREIFPNQDLSTAGAHNASVDAQDRIQAEVAPIINGKQCSVGAASGDYVLLRNSTITGKSDGAYIAAKAIPANTDIDSTYLGNAITNGISNSLNSNLTTLNDIVGALITGHTITTDSTGIFYIGGSPAVADSFLIFWQREGGIGLSVVSRNGNAVYNTGSSGYGVSISTISGRICVTGIGDCLKNAKIFVIGPKSNLELSLT